MCIYFVSADVNKSLSLYKSFTYISSMASMKYRTVVVAPDGGWGYACVVGMMLCMVCITKARGGGGPSQHK